MHAIKTVFREAVGLFVDSGSLAVAIIVAVIGSAVLLPLLPLPATARAVLLLAALLAVLVENVRRTSRTTPRS